MTTRNNNSTVYVTIGGTMMISEPGHGARAARYDAHVLARIDYLIAEIIAEKIAAAK